MQYLMFAVVKTAGETLLLGDAVYLKGSEGKLWKAVAAADDERARFFGVVSGGGAVGTATAVSTLGELALSTDLTSAGYNTVVYLSADTPGRVVTTAPSTPGQVKLKLGLVTIPEQSKILLQLGSPLQISWP